MRSIRARLLSSVIAAFVVVVVPITMISYRQTAHEVEEVFDAELAQTARLISQLNVANIDSRGAEIEVKPTLSGLGHKYEKHISYQVWFRNALLLRSGSAPVVPLAKEPGYGDIVLDGMKWRVFGLYQQASPYRIFTAEDFKARDELLWEIFLGSMKLFFWAIPVLAILVYMLLTKGLSSLVRLSNDVSLRDVDKLKPLDRRKVPDEVLPLVTALNELLGKLNSAMAKERQFTSDASHELRTPLSGIKLHAQMAMKANTKEDFEHSLKQIIRAVDKSSHLVEQLLTLYRLQPGSRPVQKTEIDLARLCQDVVAEMRPMARRSEASISLRSSPGAVVLYSNQDMLYAIVRNLIDNALRHTEEKVDIEVAVLRSGEETLIQVSDDGPGIPDELLEQVTQRFYRLAGQEVEGCGLGLAIVSEAANAIGCRLELANKKDHHGGLTATIRCGSQA